MAVRDGHLERNPVPTLAEVIKACRDRGSDEEGTRDAWTHDEAEMLLQLAWKYEPHFAPALQFALATGARRGEILALRWELVDFLQERVEIRRTVNPSGKDTKKVKTSERRFTPLEASLSAMLLNLHSSERRSADSDWAFPSPRGLLWHERNFERAWYRLRRRAKKAGVRPLPFHCTRHTFITWALEAGTPVKRVSEWVGASVSVIEQTYAHVMPQVAPDLSFADMGRKWGGLGRITPNGVTGEECEVSDDEKEMNGDPGAIRTRDPQLRRLFRES
ncbi:MAG: site-specific integrase, partial [Gemmatimonadetes bacterium]|nr:site-specific integrase [Gemmatimonadota bacterium]